MASPGKIVKKKKPKRNSRRNIRNIMKNANLNNLTKIAVKSEKERKARVNERAEKVCVCSMHIFRTNSVCVLVLVAYSNFINSLF